MANYCCLNPKCPAQFSRCSSLNRHYSRNPACSQFRHTGLDSPVFVPAHLHATRLGVLHEAPTTRSISFAPGAVPNVNSCNQSSDNEESKRSVSVHSDHDSSIGKLEHADMSFSFCFSQGKDHGEDHQLAGSESLSSPMSGGTLNQLLDISNSPSSVVPHHEVLLLPLPSVASVSSSLSDDGELHVSTTVIDDCQLQDSESVQEEHDASSLASSVSSYDYRDNCTSLEAQFESLLYDDEYDSDSNELQSANSAFSDPEDSPNQPSNLVEEHDRIKLLLDDFIFEHDVLPSRYQQQIKKLHPVEEELLIIMRKNHMSIKLFKKLMAWAKRARTSKYDFNFPTYQTVLDRMKKKYFLEAGSPPLRSTVIIGDPFPPMHVY